MSLFDFEALDSQEKVIGFDKYRGKVVLIVNVASRCGFTPQYSGLSDLQRRFGDQGLQILGFPCNQFGKQEPGSNQEIQAFCHSEYEVSFPILAKIDVNGPKTAPVYEWLKGAAPGILGTKKIKWNFTKFLVGRDGKVIERFGPNAKPESLAGPIESALK